MLKKYTVGQDYLYDQRLLKYDLQASLAHAKMLSKTGIINDNELTELEQGLNEIQNLSENGKFNITQDQEDGHTAIEQYLSAHYGEIGKRYTLAEVEMTSP